MSLVARLQRQADVRDIVPHDIVGGAGRRKRAVEAAENLPRRDVLPRGSGVVGLEDAGRRRVVGGEIKRFAAAALLQENDLIIAIENEISNRVGKRNCIEAIGWQRLTTRQSSFGRRRCSSDHRSDRR